MISFAEAGVSAASGLVSEVEAFFSQGGPLSRARNFECRPQQLEMAIAVARALEARSHAILEAGTGVGKSLAYLVPSVLHALKANRKAIICTHTINLQEQLVNKDLPIIQKLIPEEFEVALLKGRKNYLCPNRLRRALENVDGLFTDPAKAELEALEAWSRRTQDGSRSDLRVQPSLEVWSEVCSEPHICTAKTCGQECFYQRARQRVANARVVVLNHSLFLLSTGGGEGLEAAAGFLFDDDFVVIDEAHTFEGVAARHIGVSVSQRELRFNLQRLYNPKTRRGMFVAARKSNSVRQVVTAFEAADRFFEQVAKAANFKGKRESRVREPGLVQDTLSRELLKVEECAAEAAKSDASLNEPEGSLSTELEDVARKLRDTRFAIAHFLNQTEADHVYWVEKTESDSSQLIDLRSAPVDPAPALRRLLFRDGTSCILTSATLSVGRPDLAWFRSRIGADIDPPEIAVRTFGSPFDYEAQMKVFIAKGMPDPKDPLYQREMASWIKKFLDHSGGCAFVLFTSYEALRVAASELTPHCEKRGWNLLVQGSDLPPSKMLEEFRTGDRPSVLFGTDTFWGGVDVPGEALSNVIITRLPFATPANPLIEARLDFVKARGGDPFTEFSLPEAVLKFRQGVGRLIRSRHDRGIVAILDSRILTQSYGKSFLNALPVRTYEIVDRV